MRRGPNWSWHPAARFTSRSHGSATIGWSVSTAFSIDQSSSPTTHLTMQMSFVPCVTSMSGWASAPVLGSTSDVRITETFTQRQFEPPSASHLQRPMGSLASGYLGPRRLDMRSRTHHESAAARPCSVSTASPSCVATHDSERLALLWREICVGWPRYESALTAELQCYHGWHSGASIRHVQSLLDYMLRNTPWVPCIRGEASGPSSRQHEPGGLPPTRPHGLRRVDVLNPRSTSWKCVRRCHTWRRRATRPAAKDLVALLRELSREPHGAHFDDADEEEIQQVGRDVQLATKWAMRILNDGSARRKPRRTRTFARSTRWTSRIFRGAICGRRPAFG